MWNVKNSYRILKPFNIKEKIEFIDSVRVHTRRDSPNIAYTVADFLLQLVRGIRRLGFGGFVVFSLPASIYF